MLNLIEDTWASWALEGFRPTPDDYDTACQIIRGEITIDEAIARA